MVQSNEFTAATLAGAVRKATALLSALFGLEDNTKARELGRDVGRLQARADDAIAKMEDLAQSYLNANCHLIGPQS